MSTSTRIAFIGCAKYHFGALSISKTPLWCVLQAPKRRPQQGLQSLEPRTPFWCTLNAQNTTLVHFPYSKHHSGAFCKDQNVVVNTDCIHWMTRTPFWCTLNVQNTTLVHFASTKASSLTRIAIIGCPEHRSGAGAFSIPKTSIWCILQAPKSRPQRGLQSLDARTPFWCTLNVQNTILVHFASTKMSTSTRIAFIG